jgi:hypothetical protein
MSAKNDGYVCPNSSKDSRAAYSPGREEFEIQQAYNSLVRAGGRPICSLGETASISKNPEEWRKILAPWLESPLSDGAINWKTIFQQQLSNWELFKAWQHSNRNTQGPTPPGTLLEDAGDERRGSLSSSDGDALGLTRFEAHLAKARHQLDHHCGFTKSFTFNVDTGRQDEWTTWVEYLSFECYCCHPRHGRLEGAAPLDVRPAVSLRAREEDPASQVGAAQDGLMQEAEEANGTGRHDLILEWALLQEPDIAAASASRQRELDVAGDVWQKVVLGPRLKRNRDGSLCMAGNVVFQTYLLGGIEGDEDGAKGHKRSRNLV